MKLNRIIGWIGFIVLIASFVFDAELSSLIMSTELSGIVDVTGLQVINAACVSVSPLEEFCGPNPGGQNKIFVINRRDVATMPAVTVATHTIATDIVPKTGKAFVEWNFALDTGELTSETIGEQGNQACKVGVGVYIPRSNPAIEKVMNDCYNGQFIVIVQDGLGQKRVAGSLERGLMFSSKYTSGKKFDDKNGREVGFSGGQPNEPYFYGGAIALTAAI